MTKNTKKKPIKLENIKPMFGLPSIYLKNIIRRELNCNKCCCCKFKETIRHSLSKSKLNEHYTSNENLNSQCKDIFNDEFIHDSGNESDISSAIISSSSFQTTTFDDSSDSQLNDEFFYDANDSFHFDIESNSLTSESDIEAISLALVEFDSNDDDFDDEQLDMSKEKSIVTYVLSQLRIGMDLESISLPSFILDSRSLLEMYADFYSYPNLFLQIPDARTSYERMLLVVKWYMSTFRARIVAKKPYNPVLGEIFQCVFNTDLDNNKELVREGPVPWANKNQLTFIAEQVSHHPPISAFYLEHYNKRIQINGYTESKSKFLGLSVAVESIGKVVLSLLDHQEEYELTFPTAYVRSILTVPWLEMCGHVTIKCKQSGFSADIDFLSKPFYGGKKHQVKGKIYSPSMSVLNTIDGTWSETMYVNSNLKYEELIDSNLLIRHKKLVRKLEEQNDNESRKIWRDVTISLRNKQNDSATRAKNLVEQKQREKSLFRKENKIEWQTKYFHLVDNEWCYVKPLSKRLN